MNADLLKLAEEASQAEPPDRMGRLERRVARLELLLWVAVALGIIDQLKPFIGG